MFELDNLRVIYLFGEFKMLWLTS